MQITVQNEQQCYLCNEPCALEHIGHMDCQILCQKRMTKKVCMYCESKDTYGYSCNDCKIMKNPPFKTTTELD